jgi:hypothetical protein
MGGSLRLTLRVRRPGRMQHQKLQVMDVCTARAEQRAGRTYEYLPGHSAHSVQVQGAQKHLAPSQRM